MVLSARSRVRCERKEIAIIELTEQQRQELRTTDVLQLLDPVTGKTYVLVQAEVYERLKGLLEDEPQVTGEMVDRLMEEEDRDDPTLAFYQERLGGRLHHEPTRGQVHEPQTPGTA